jgi:uncharacterized protein (DUF1330 family)
MPAYLHVDIEVLDPVAYEDYRRDAPAIIAAHGGRYLVRGGAATLLEGDRPLHRQVVLEFPTMAQLQAFYDDPAYQPLKALRQRVTRSTVVAVQGIG